jgi:SMODS-associating 2TM, beta-strand rich effector domain
MHAYATDARDRELVPALLAVVAVVGALVLYGTLGALKVSAPWWLDAPSVMGFYGGLRALYDRWLWHLHVGPLALSEIPALRGTWAGEVQSSFSDGLTPVPVVLVVRQTWSMLSVRLLAEHSASFSESATLNTAGSARDGLTYAYLNEPETFSLATMHTHRGLALLKLAADGTRLEGDYFTGRDRQNIGAMRLQHVSRELLGREEALRRATTTSMVGANTAAPTAEADAELE